MIRCKKRVSKIIIAVVSITILVLLWKLYRRGLLVVIVEEHHEVLPYWMDAVLGGDLDYTNNILIHVDAHSDDALPEFIPVPGMAFFSFPNSFEQTFLYMQRNDVFIQAAIISGIFSRVIWVWPSWSSDINNEIKSGHFHTHMKVGWFKLQENSTYFCVCRMTIEDSEECSYMNYTDGTQVHSLPKQQCNVMRIIEYELWRDDMAASLLSNAHLNSQSNILLDIDEDFFGCESGATPLQKMNIEWNNVYQLNAELEDLFCPRQQGHEAFSNRMMRLILDHMLKNCQWVQASKCDNYYDFVNDICTQLVLEWAKHRHRLAFCAWTSESLCDKVIDVLVALASFSKDQLAALRALGFCLSNSLNTLPVAQSECCMRVCHGYNLPNETEVILHSESHSQMEFRAQTLEQLFEAIRQTTMPRLVTIARSVRDGFTQRNDASFIEHIILDKLRTVFGQTTVLFDSNLLGGPVGWLNRHDAN